jgi:hypothetical protein
MSKFVVTFAGPVGSSKTPIAHHLSYTFNLPIFNNDTIRTEVAEDLLQFDNEEFRKRARKRIKNIVDRDLPFIYDASVDRTWEEIKQILINNNYRWFIINLDLSKSFLVKLYQVKNYEDSLSEIDRFIAEHHKFLKKHKNDISLNINDQNFSNRLSISASKLAKWLKNQINPDTPVKL